MPLSQRRSGVLLHPTSLPSPYGIGDLSSADTFLDYLEGALQTLWQVLPLGPTGYGDSPYASPSAFAGNPLLISPEQLLSSGLLQPAELGELASLPADRVDYGAVSRRKRQLLELAFSRTQQRGDVHERLDAFRRQHADWLDDYALFSALSERYDGLWTDWEPPLRDRDPQALDQARAELAERIDFFTFCQQLFADQWWQLRRAASKRGIAIIGDIPIFVAYDSADVWAHRHLFKLDAEGRPRVVAGVPPDYFSATGQLWGNPLYDWQAMAGEGYAWWIARFRHLAELVDLVRVDHFRGFQAAWEVPAGAPTAVEGAWVPGPGTAVFDAIAEALGGSVPVIAEDLGLITDEVRELLAQTGFPGMKVLQFAFGGGTDNLYLPHNFTDPNCVVYSGTHDNDTTTGWFASASEHERDFVRRYSGTDGEHIAFDVMRLALGSVARTAIVPLQDVLGLGSAARMNTPGASDGNWAWRVQADQLDPACAQRLAELTRLYGRA